MARHTVIASAALCALVLPAAGWAATSSTAATSSPGATSNQPPTSQAPMTQSSTSGAANSTSSSGSPSTSNSSPTPAGLTVEQPLRLHLDGKGVIDQGALPQPEALFTTGELKSALPQLRSTSADDGTITLDLPNESGDERSHIVVTMKRFGKKGDVEKAWASEKTRHQTRSERIKGLYTFYRAGEHGVADAFTDGTTTHVLVTDGDAAGEIWFSGVGFGSLAATHAKGRATYTASVTPKLIELIGAKVRAGSSKPAEAHAPAGTQSSTPSASSTS